MCKWWSLFSCLSTSSLTFRVNQLSCTTSICSSSGIYIGTNSVGLYWLMLKMCMFLPHVFTFFAPWSLKKAWLYDCIPVIIHWIQRRLTEHVGDIPVSPSTPLLTPVYQSPRPYSPLCHVPLLPADEIHIRWLDRGSSSTCPPWGRGTHRLQQHLSQHRG